MEIRDSIKSVVEVSGIFLEAARDMTNRVMSVGKVAIAQQMDKIDTKLANACNGPEDEN